MHYDSTCRLVAAAALLLVAAACGDEPSPDDLLPSLGASGIVAVSGISSGGYMAGQFHVAFSASVSGAAIVAAGPWGCAKGDINRALKTCISGDGLDIDELHALAAELVASGTIDDTSGLGEARALVFHGTGDAVIGASVVAGLQQWLGTYLEVENIQAVTDVPAVHGWPTIDHGGACDTFAAPYIMSCGYDLAGEILSHLHGDLDAPRSALPLRRFDQRPFGDAGLADFGYVYVPLACEDAPGCDLHVFFHGCEQSSDAIGTELADNAGFNRWAESNDIVVLYPQVEKSLAAPMNPLGCWDWWGYTGSSYLEKTAPQLAAVRRMVATLARER